MAEPGDLGAPGAGYLALPKPFPSRYGVPVLTAVDPAMFRLRYFTHCLDCTFCRDWCCSFGVDVDLRVRDRLLAAAAELAAFTGIPPDRWFQRRVSPDPNLPGGGSVRTRVVRGACVFLDRQARGCRLHRYAVAAGLDYHEVKPLVDCLFPLTFQGGVLLPADEALEGALVCLDTGPTLYRGCREELRYYFGDELVASLDALEAARAW